MHSEAEWKLKTTKFTWSDRMVSLREALLDWITRTKSRSVLNREPIVSTIDTEKLSTGVREALKRIRAGTMDAQGNEVDYAVLRDHPDYLDFRRELSPSLRKFNPASLASQSERMAFWINLYHVLVLDAVISFGVKRSVTEGWFGVMSFFRRAAYEVGGYRLSLNDIEHGILRNNHGHPLIPGPQFGPSDHRREWVIPSTDARIHFALNCASRSCPPIHSYDAILLDAQLRMAARNFVDTNLKINPAKQLLIVSNIFRWFSLDFGGQEGVISFLIHHLPLDGRRAWLSEHRASMNLVFEPYDWSLNQLI